MFFVAADQMCVVPIPLCKTAYFISISGMSGLNNLLQHFGWIVRIDLIFEVHFTEKCSRSIDLDCELLLPDRNFLFS